MYEQYREILLDEQGTSRYRNTWNEFVTPKSNVNKYTTFNTKHHDPLSCHLSRMNAVIKIACMKVI